MQPHTLLLIPTYFEASKILGEIITDKTLLEHTAGISPVNILSSEHAAERPPKFCAVGLCGFGISAAGAGAAFAITEYQRIHRRLPERVILLGIAGSYNLEVLPLGSLAAITKVACYGIGRGTGDAFESAEAMGWKQAHETNQLAAEGDSLQLETPVVSAHAAGCALTVPASSTKDTDRLHRGSLPCSPVVEEMETYSVALACRLYDIPLSTYRAISNEVGASKEHWDIDAACASLSHLVSNELLSSF